jgi:hypothetical protein
MEFPVRWLPAHPSGDPAVDSSRVFLAVSGATMGQESAMPDFDLVRICVPYRAAFSFRGAAHDCEVDEAFEVPVVSVSRDDAPLALLQSST